MRSILVTGFPRQAAYLSGLLNGHVPGIRTAAFRDTRIATFRAALHALQADASITVGGPRPNGFVRAICENRNRPAILLWVGSDVTYVAEHSRELEPLLLQNLVHWTCAPHLAEELKELGIDARYVPIASAAVEGDAAPLPAAFSVLTYLPYPGRAFYGQDCVWEAARELSDVSFVVVGRGEQEPGAPPNVTYAGEVGDVNARLDASAVLFRFPEHDGMPMMVIEALARGRHVIWNYPFPGVIHAASPSQAINALIRLRDAHREGALAVNEIGRRHVADCYAPSSIARGIVSAVEDEIANARLSPKRRTSKLRVAVSGQEVLSARVAGNFQKYSGEIAGTVLTTPTMSDTVISTLRLVRSDAWYTIYEPLAPKPFEFAAFMSRKRRIVHWLGDDVDELESNPELLRRFQSRSTVHLAHDSRIAERLKSLGLRANVVPLPAVTPVNDLQPLPQTFTVILFLPPNEPEPRNGYERLMAALERESMHYIVIGGGAINVPAGVSVERIARRRDIGDVYDRSTAFIRLDRATCVPTMVIETLLHGRYVFCADEVPFARIVRDYAGLEHGVRSLLQRHKMGLLTPDAAAANAMKEAYDPQRWLQVVAQACAGSR